MIVPRHDTIILMNDSKKRVLIVEDELPLAKALALKLQSAGFEVELCHNGDEALAMIEKSDFDLVLMDLMMPRRDGFSVLGELQGKKAPPVFVMSNLGQDEDMKRARDLGAQEYIIKSNTSLSAIVEKVKSSLSMNGDQPQATGPAIGVTK
jgi:DNA-binding response OmpR family regulator